MAPTPLWTVEETCEFLRVSPATLYRLLDRDPTFPRRIHLSARAVRFRGDLVEAWVCRQAESPAPSVGRPARAVRA